MTIFCDEAGNTGENLFDEEQPFFVLASNDYNHAEALNLLKHVQLPQNNEVKFKTLKKTKNGENKLEDLFKDPLYNKNRIYIDVFHKEFLVVCKLVDLVIETIFYKTGYTDLYRQGANIAMSNMLFHCLPVFCGRDVTLDFYQAFVELVRFKTPQHKKAFLLASQRLNAECQDDDTKKEILPFFSKPECLNLWFDTMQHTIPPLDPAIPSLFEHICRWGERKQHRFSIIHDNSKPILVSQETFNEMMALKDEQSQEIGYDRRKFLFPLRAESLKQGDSKHYPQLQLADIAAGSINHYLKCIVNKKLDNLAKIIEDTFLPYMGVEIAGLLPSTDVTPESLGTNSDDGVNPVDSIASYLTQKEKRN